MSHTISSKHAWRVAIVVLAAITFAALPVAAQAAPPVNLGTAATFVVLGGSTVTNTGPSVLNGDLGVAPGTALVGFGLPAVVNGATHDDDAVASQAQSDLTTAYTVAASEPVAPANDLTGTDLGNRILDPGAYAFSSSAQLTGQLTLNAHGDPSAQFVFEIGTTLTTASASSVVLINGASPCNVYWQIGSSATLGSTTAFQGNLMALSSISLNTGATVQGRALARNGAVTLDDNVLNASMCGASTTSTPGATTPGAGTPGATTPGSGTPGSPGTSPGTLPPASQSTLPTRIGTAILRRTPGSATACTAGFSATVHGKKIKHVTFSLDKKQIASLAKSPFRVFVRAPAGEHAVTAHVTFKDATRAKNLTVPYRACAAAIVRVKPQTPVTPLPQPQPGPAPFTG